MSQRIIDAILNSQYSQLLLFMRHNYNFKIKTKSDSKNILMIALDIKDPKRRLKMLKFLIRQNLVNLLENDKNGQDIFFHCIIKELDNEFDYLLKDYFTELDLTKSDNFGKTILHYAVIKNNSTILTSLAQYCSRYKINVDIPDKISKITPYLLACRLNHSEAADILLKIGHASKNQADQSSFFDAEQWKKEGQLELFKSYLKINETEINNAKLKGNLRVFKELRNLSESLDTEVEKNPDILPVIAKVIHEQNVKDVKTSLTTVPSIKSRKITPEISNEISYFNRKEPNIDRFKYASSSSNSFVPSTTSSSAFSNYSKSPQMPRNSIDRTKPELNFLLEMAENQTRVDHYVNSKSESELKTVLSDRSTSSSGNRRNNKNANLNLHHLESHINHRSFDLSDIFNVASAQNTDSYRKTVKYVPEQPVLTRRNSKLKHKPKCISTFKLITIDEESKLSSSFRKMTNSKIKITT